MSESITSLVNEVEDARAAINHYLVELSKPSPTFGAMYCARQVTTHAARLECALAILKGRPARPGLNDIVTAYQESLVVAID